GGENSKHGIWYADMPAALEVLQRYNLKLVGIHMHIGSGVDYGHLEEVCGAMVRQVIDFGQDLEAISAGGGLSIPYREGEEAIDTDHYYGLWSAARDSIAAHLGHAVKLEIEPGRFLVAEAGVLVAQVRSVKEMGSRHFVLIDAGFNDLMRPSMYGSYHHITALAADGRDLVNAPRIETVVAGPLCESGDVCTQQEGGKVETRSLPEVKPGDYLVLHDTGAYGASMSSNYNSRPLLPEVLFDNGVARLIRRRQTIQELLALELVCLNQGPVVAESRNTMVPVNGRFTSNGWFFASRIALSIAVIIMLLINKYTDNRSDSSPFAFEAKPKPIGIISSGIYSTAFCNAL